MTRNGAGPGEHARSDRGARGGFAPDVEAYLARRTAQFQQATSGRGLPQTWGAGKGPRPGFEPKTSSTRRRKTG